MRRRAKGGKRNGGCVCDLHEMYPLVGRPQLPLPLPLELEQLSASAGTRPTAGGAGEVVGDDGVGGGGTSSSRGTHKPVG